MFEKIILEGFLSYKEKQEIDLRNISTSLVLGRINGDPELSNGAGKSSLFEAIPVNFFGKGSGRADILDSYINDEMNKMLIELFFIIDNQRYKTIRSKTRGNSSAIFEIFYDTTNEELEKATWKKSDRTIEDVLGLSSKTYSSIIYLNEREALQIITGTSSERKEILRELLSIEIYEEATKKSNKEFDDIDRKLQVNLNLINDKQEQIKNEDILKDQLKRIEEELTNFKERSKRRELQLKELNNKKKNLEISFETYKLLEEQIDKETKSLEEINSKIQKIEKKILDLNNEVEDQNKKFEAFKTDIEESSKTKDSIRAQIIEIKENLQDLDKFDEELKNISENISKKIEEKNPNVTSINILKSEKRTIEQNLEQNFQKVLDLKEEKITQKENDEIFVEKISKIKTEIDVNKKEIFEIEKNLKQLEVVDEELKKTIEDISSKKEEKNSLVSDLNVLKTEKKSLEVFLEKLENFNSVCPITEIACETLKGEYKENFIEEKQKELTKKQKQITEVQEKIQKNEFKIEQLSKLEIEQKQKLKSRQIDNEKILKLKLSLQNFENDAEKFKEKQKENSTKKEITEKEIFKFLEQEVVLKKEKEEKQKTIEELQGKLLIIDEQLEVLLKEQKAIELKTKSRQKENENLTKLKLSLQSIEKDEKRFKEKEEEFKIYLVECKEEKDELKAEISSKKTEIEDKTKNIEVLKSKLNLEILTQLKEVKSDIEDYENALRSLREQIEAQNIQLGEVKNQLEKIEDLKNDIKFLTKSNEDFMDSKKVLQTLSEFFGKDGIQKAIMKQSIPVLEEYTLEFLKIFNEDSEKIKVKFELDPKRKDGEFKKGGGLEILVLEEDKEPKDLKMYSGGETVRIVFSIILALAKLLSERSGKSHDTLIIDEKIAKLDSRGITQFGDVIKEISQIYKQVFIITHLENLKDMIVGNEIIVNKTDDEGSIVTIQ